MVGRVVLECEFVKLEHRTSSRSRRKKKEKEGGEIFLGRKRAISRGIHNNTTHQFSIEL